LTCVAMAGNPLADLKWYRGGELVPDGVAVTTKNEEDMYSTSELTLTASREDNGREYRCEASNEAMAEPKTDTVTLAVMFKPDLVTVKVEPEQPVAGKKALLT